MKVWNKGLTIFSFIQHKKVSARLILLAIFALCSLSCIDVHKFEGVSGPDNVSELYKPIPALPEDFDKGTSSRLAIWLTSEESHWIALASGLKTIGVPFRLTTSYKEALNHDVVMVYPFISGRDLPADSFKAMRSYVNDGGTLLGFSVLGGGLNDMFGISGVIEGKDKAFLTFDTSYDETAGFTERGLKYIKIGNEESDAVNAGSNAYTATDAEVLAVYEDGTAAMTRHTYGKGQAYAIGLDIGQLLSKGYNRRQVLITDSYANRYRPTLDALLIFLEAVYQHNQEGAVTLGTVPDGKDLSFVLSHDLDYSKSLTNAIPYAQQQKQVGLAATYFIQTKYIKDYNDEIFMNEKGASDVKTLESLGAEIASHSVAHAEDMWDFPFGDGTETYPDYRPFVQAANSTRNGTLMGELRVSKFLLENFAKENNVISFRPGYLSDPFDLPQALTSSGFKYSSSVTANVSLTHLPFQLTYGRGFKSFTPIYEFPITIEDELPPKMIDRLDEAKQVARDIARIGGLYMVLIHTDAVDTRLDFQKAIISEVRSYAWMGPLREFGAWWTARDSVGVDVTSSKDVVTISLVAPMLISGLTLEMEDCYEIIANDGLEINCKDGNYLLGDLEGERIVTLRRPN